MLLVLAILFYLFPAVSTSGYLLLDITASTDADLRLSANLNVDYFHLTGEVHTSLIRPVTGARRVTVEFSMYGSKAQEVTFELESHIVVKKVMVFGDVAILVEAVFECDKGFQGRLCQSQKIHRVPKIRSLTTKTLETTSPVPTTTSTTPAPIPMDYLNLYIFLTSYLVTFLLLLIVIFTVFFIYSTCCKAQKNQKTPEIPKSKIFTLPSTSPDATSRYTPAPFVYVSNV